MPKIAAPVVGLPGKAGDAAVPLPEGQDLAEPGKELPDAVLGLDGKSEDQPEAQADGGDDTSAEDAPPPPFAWFAIAPPPAAQPEAKVEAPAGVTIDTAGKRARPDVQVPIVEAGETKPAEAKTAAPATVSTTPPVMPQAKPQPARRGDVQRQPKADATAPVDPAEVPVVEAGSEAPKASSDTDKEAAAQPVLAQPPRELRKAAADAPVVRIALDKPEPQQKLSIADITQNQRQAATAPASPPLADQIVAAFELPQTRTSRAPAEPQVDLSTVAAPATGTQTVAAVTATGQGQDATLDTRDQQWTAKMIDKIETLQGGGPVRETRLSLMPEGLGKVDISIRQDDAGSLHVQFNTDTQAARQVIADAQPKLAEIAQERGIRLGSTSVESNASGTNGGTGAGSNTNPQMNQGQRNDAQPQRNQPSAPPSARREAQSSTNSDERVA
ncbi:flagellar hook-length control protein FliK [Sphingomonas sp. R-74633]|nr:flagellar hook-length control protein FliK [Sphingomonas sp. R-74633]